MLENLQRVLIMKRFREKFKVIFPFYCALSLSEVLTFCIYLFHSYEIKTTTNTTNNMLVVSCGTNN